MNQSPKSATTAGLLGIFLGAFGAHSWYLGDKKNGIIHVSLVGGGILLAIIGAAIIPAIALSSLSTLGLLMAAPTIAGIGSAVVSGSAIWGLVEGIIILVKGDAGLAAKGIPVAAPMPAAQGYGQPMPPQGYAQPMQQPMYQQPMPPQGYAQPMPGQSYAQPMQPQGYAQPMPGQGYDQNQQPMMPQDQNGGDNVNAA